MDLEKLSLSKGANKIREFSDKCTRDKRKLLVKELDTHVEELLLDSLDEVRNMSPNDQVKKKSFVPVIPRASRKKKPAGESSEAFAQKVPRVTFESSIAKTQEDKQNKEIITTTTNAGQTEVST